MQIELMDLPMPLVLRPAEPLSDEELIAFSERNQPFRIERLKNGDLTLMTPLGGISGLNETRVVAQFTLWGLKEPRGRVFGPNVGFNLPDGSCLAPDAAWVSSERWNALTDDQKDSFLPFCPDFLIEVRSKSDRRRPLEEKMQLWMENGATLAWLIDPIDATVTIYRTGQQPETLTRPDSIKATEPVAGFTLHTAELWPDP